MWEWVRHAATNAARNNMYFVVPLIILGSMLGWYLLFHSFVALFFSRAALYLAPLILVVAIICSAMPLRFADDIHHRTFPEWLPLAWNIFPWIGVILIWTARRIFRKSKAPGGMRHA